MVGVGVWAGCEEGVDGVGAPEGGAGVVVALPCGDVTLTLLLTLLLNPLLLLFPLPVLFDTELPPLLLLLLLQLLLLLLLLLLPFPLVLFKIPLLITPLGSGECLPVCLEGKTKY